MRVRAARRSLPKPSALERSCCSRDTKPAIGMQPSTASGERDWRKSKCDDDEDIHVNVGTALGMMCATWDRHTVLVRCIERPRERLGRTGTEMGQGDIQDASRSRASYYAVCVSTI